jgi:hypothetical protein
VPYFNILGSSIEVFPDESGLPLQQIDGLTGTAVEAEFV